MKKVIGVNYHSIAYSSMIGFTVKKDYLQFKNYYELKEMPSDEQLTEFLPEIDSFKMVSQFWDKNVKSSLALGLKLDNSGKETKYFHVKFGDLSRFVIQPMPAFIKLLEEKKPDSGISYEYTDGEVVKKCYLYIINKSDIEKILKLSKIEANSTDLEHLECYYTDDEFKVNLIYTTPQVATPNLGELDEATSKAYKEVTDFLTKENKPVWYIGISKKKKVSVYATTTDDKDFIERL